MIKYKRYKIDITIISSLKYIHVFFFNFMNGLTCKHQYFLAAILTYWYIPQTHHNIYSLLLF